MRIIVVATALLMLTACGGNLQGQYAENRSEDDWQSETLPGMDRPRGRAAIVVDEGTGCEYTIRTSSEAIDIQPRNEAHDGDTRQRCGAAKAGSSRFVSLGGDDLRVLITAVADRATGCQEIVVTRLGSAMDAVPRAEVHGERRRQICRR